MLGASPRTTGDFLDLKRQAAPGIDGVTWQDYAKDLETRILKPKILHPYPNQRFAVTYPR